MSRHRHKESFFKDALQHLCCNAHTGSQEWCSTSGYRLYGLFLLLCELILHVVEYGVFWLLYAQWNPSGMEKED